MYFKRILALPASYWFIIRIRHVTSLMNEAKNTLKWCKTSLPTMYVARS